MGLLPGTLYVRVSKDDLRNGRSVGRQAREAQDDADREGIEIGARFEDNDRSASRHARRGREEYARLIEHLETVDTGKGHVLLLWESSRGSRELQEWAALLNLCRRRGIFVRVVTHHRTYDLALSRDWRGLAEDGIDNEYEVEKTRVRVSSGVALNAAKGRPHGLVLYGYRRERDPNTGKLIAQVIDPERAEIVREIFRRVANKDELQTIAKDLNRREIPSPRCHPNAENACPLTDSGRHVGAGWSGTGVRKIVTNPGYIGRRVHRGIVLDGVKAIWESLVDEELFNRCVELVTDPARKSSKDHTVKWLLSGIAVCARCRTAVTTQKNSGKLAYVSKCYHVGLPAEEAELFVNAEIKRLLKNISLVDVSPAEEAAEVASALEEVRSLREELEGARRQATSQRKKGSYKLSPEALAMIEGDLLPRIESALHRSRVRTLPLSVQRAIESRGEAWDDLSIPQKREVLKNLFEIDILRAGKGKRLPAAERVRVRKRGSWERDIESSGEGKLPTRPDGTAIWGDLPLLEALAEDQERQGVV